MQQHTREELKKAELVGSLLMPDAIASMKLFIGLATILLGWLSVSLEVFVRHEFGERYLSWLRLYFAWIMVASVGVFLPSIFGAPNPLSFYIGYGIYIAFILLALWHRLTIRRRRKRQEKPNPPEPLHSMCSGYSHLSWIPVKEWTLYLWVEPLFFIIISLLLWRFFGGLAGAWLLLSSVGMLIKNQMEYYNNRGQLLDMIDAQIEAKYFSAALANRGENKRETGGFVVADVYTGNLFDDEEPDISATVDATMQNNEPEQPPTK